MDRSLFTFILFILILFFPYWIYLPILLGSIIFMPFYFEAVLLAFLAEVLYGGRIHPGLSLSFPLAIATTILVLIMLPIQQRLRLHA